MASFDPKVQNLIRRVLQSYDPSVETRPVSTNLLVTDATAIVTFATTYLFAHKDVDTEGGGAEENKPSEKEIESVQKVIVRLKKLWEARASMFEALATEQELEGEDAWAPNNLHRYDLS